MAGKDEVINMPFITRFLFTCIKEKKDSYKLEWSFSLCYNKKLNRMLTVIVIGLLVAALATQLPGK